MRQRGQNDFWIWPEVEQLFQPRILASIVVAYSQVPQHAPIFIGIARQPAAGFSEPVTV